MSGDRLLHAARAAIGPSLADATVVALWNQIAAASPSERKALEDAVLQAVCGPSTLAGERERVFLARLITALVPFRFSALEVVLTQTGGDESAELQFSVFVALTDIHEIASPPQLARVLHHVQSFLSEIVVDRRQEAWMAGDLLGDHWPLDEALPALTLLVKKARHPAGRRAAVHGLSHAIERATKHEQWKIVETLRGAADADESGAVRRAANAALNSVRDS